MGSLHDTSPRILKSPGVHVHLGGMGGTCALGDPVSPEEFQKVWGSRGFVRCRKSRRFGKSARYRRSKKSKTFVKSWMVQRCPKCPGGSLLSTLE